ncbi:LuxR C-terminal-related transcriptional regulator [Streptomyces sp. TR06-5]|uniref:LuxR C-terminal-related transcriptional regulator n=1 Tax=unclassified Streptomyces TaxID=2593676 RepID=UPI0039A393B9
MNHEAIHRSDAPELVGDSALGRLEVMIFHRDEIFRSGLKTLLRSLPGVSGVHVTDSATRARTALIDRRPDAMLVSSSLDASTLKDLLTAAERADVKTLLLLSSLDRERVRRASRLSAQGFLLEPGLDATGLMQALNTVARGEIAVPPLLVQELLTEMKTGGRADTGPQLTPREEAALSLLVEGMSNKQIARRLGISEHGAKRHVSNVLAKLNCPNRTVAAVVAVEEGLIPAPRH